MFRTSSPRDSLQMFELGDDDAPDAYESYVVSDDPSMSVGVDTEVSDGNVRRD